MTSAAALPWNMYRPQHGRAWAGPRGANVESREQGSLRVSDYLLLVGATDLYVIVPEAASSPGVRVVRKTSPWQQGRWAGVPLSKCVVFVVFSGPQENPWEGGSHSPFRDEETEAEGD